LDAKKITAKDAVRTTTRIIAVTLYLILKMTSGLLKAKLIIAILHVSGVASSKPGMSLYIRFSKVFLIYCFN